MADIVTMPAEVVYVDGVFDLFHAGHVAFLQKALALGGADAKLVAGVITDADAGWKRRPVIAHGDRAAVVRACRYVSEVVEVPPLVLTDEFLDRHGITMVVHGDDDRQEKFFAAAIKRGCMHYVPYSKGISTSEIIQRVSRIAA